MLHSGLVFFVVALVAAFLAFGALTGTVAMIAKLLFVAFLVVAAVSLLMSRRVPT